MAELTGVVPKAVMVSPATMPAFAAGDVATTFTTRAPGVAGVVVEDDEDVGRVGDGPISTPRKAPRVAVAGTLGIVGSVGRMLAAGAALEPQTLNPIPTPSATAASATTTTATTHGYRCRVRTGAAGERPQPPPDHAQGGGGPQPHGGGGQPWGASPHGDAPGG